MLLNQFAINIGSHTIRFHGIAGLLIQLPNGWESYLSDRDLLKTTDVHLQIAKMPACSTRNGWEYRHNDNKICATYSYQGKQCFTVVYDYLSCAAPLSVIGSSSLNLLSGMQYACLLALASEYIGLHGVTVVCGNRVVILSAPSGTGKTTLANLLCRHCNATIVNGDFAMLSAEGSKGVDFIPTPFCGTSRICQNNHLKVDRIVFLEQSQRNEWLALDVRNTIVRIMSNIFIPEWDSDKQSSIKSLAIEAATSIPTGVFSFAPTQEAAEMFFSIVTQ